MNLKRSYPIDFEVYLGSKGPQNQYKSNFGLGGEVLFQFSDILSMDAFDALPFHVFADNFFLSVKETEEFTKRSLGLTGTLRKDRIQDCPLKSINILSKEKRDFYTDSSSQTLCRCNDNSVV